MGHKHHTYITNTIKNDSTQISWTFCYFAVSLFIFSWNFRMIAQLFFSLVCCWWFKFIIIMYRFSFFVYFSFELMMFSFSYFLLYSRARALFSSIETPRHSLILNELLWHVYSYEHLFVFIIWFAIRNVLNIGYSRDLSDSSSILCVL